MVKKMGGRKAGSEGKQKKKSIKANVTSKFGTKRKLSRMGKKVKKGQMGPSTEFVTRSSALKKLQVTLKDFRRLCILKGIYPRVPTKTLKGRDKLYYDIKDISYIAHEPLLMKFREFKAFMKKIRRAAGRNQFNEARRKDAMKPKFALDHLVKERYPRFIDALRDLDDALCMIHLFAALPSEGRILAEHTAACKQLARQWLFYVARSRTLHRVFISVKGAYFQAEIMGEPVTWLVPHQFTQALPKEVDFRVMLTFLEFYESFLKFAFFKLYQMQGMQYPPMVDKQLDSVGASLLAVRCIDNKPLTTSTPPTDAVSNADVVSTPVGAISGGPAGASVKNTGKEATATAEVSATVRASAKRVATLPALFRQGRVLEQREKKADGTPGDGGSDSDDNDSDDERMKVLGEEEEEEEEEDGLALGALSGPLDAAFGTLHTLNGKTAAAVSLRGGGGLSEEVDEEEKLHSFAVSLADNSEGAAQKSNPGMFSRLTFFINREVPLEWLQFCVTSFGGRVAWQGEGSPLLESDAAITHQIVDRPLQNKNSSSSSREFVQPQWVFDCINAQMLLPVSHYRPGAKLPPHLSPFVDDEREGYMPQYREELRKLSDPSFSSSSALSVPGSTAAAGTSAGVGGERGGGPAKRGRAREEDDEEEEEEESRHSGQQGRGESSKNNNNSSNNNNKKSGGKGGAASKRQKLQHTEASELAESAEAQELSRMMMSKKTKRLYGRMQHGIALKQEAVQTLADKRKRIEEQQQEPQQEQQQQQQQKNQAVPKISAVRAPGKAGKADVDTGNRPLGVKGSDGGSIGLQTGSKISDTASAGKTRTRSGDVSAGTAGKGGKRGKGKKEASGR